MHQRVKNDYQVLSVLPHSYLEIMQQCFFVRLDLQCLHKILFVFVDFLSRKKFLDDQYKHFVVVEYVVNFVKIVSNDNRQRQY